MIRISFAVAVLLGIAAPQLARAQDATAGQALFKRDCAACHEIVPAKIRIGPSLFGIVGRAAGADPNFHYTAANKNSALTWDQATLDRYLVNPKAVVPGTTMTYAGQKDDRKRGDLIAYLATLR